MGDEEEDAGGCEEALLATSRFLLKKITSAARIIISKLPLPPPPPPPLPPPLLPTQNMQNFEVGKLAFTLATTATLGLLFSKNFPAAEAQYLVVVVLMGSCAILWNGIFFEKKCLELLGISLILVCFYVLVGSFLPLRYSWACWLAAAVSLIPFLHLLINSHQLA